MVSTKLVLGKCSVNMFSIHHIMVEDRDERLAWCPAGGRPGLPEISRAETPSYIPAVGSL